MMTKLKVKYFLFVYLFLRQQATCYVCINGLCTCSDHQVSCQESGLTSVPSSETLLKVKNVAIIDLSDNHLDTLPANIFSAHESLQILLLSNNSVENVDEACFNTSLMSRVSPLRHIDLRDNHLHFFPAPFGKRNSTISSLDRLHTLLIGGNLFGSRLDMNSFAGISEIKKLDLSRNLLRVVPDLFFKKLHHLEDLDLSSNKMHKISSMIFSQHVPLRSLKLRQNLLTRVPGNLPQVLTNLDLSSNTINGLTPKDVKNLNILTNLEILDLSRNEICFIIYGTFTKMPQLRYLDISYNSLKVLDVDSMTGAKNLKYFFLHSNPALFKITNFEYATLPKLEYLALQQCLIKTINIPFVNNKGFIRELKKIWLFGNPLTCDCYILPLVRFLKENQVQLDPINSNNFSDVRNMQLKKLLQKKFSKDMKQIGTTKCVAPLNRYQTVVGKKLLEIPEAHLTCPDELRFVIISSFLGIFAFLGVIPVVMVLIYIYLLARRFVKAHLLPKKEKEE